MVTIDHIQLRYRVLNPPGAWIYVDLPVGQNSIPISGIDRSLTYQFEARSVAASGAVSAWIQQNHTVAETTIGPLGIASVDAYDNGMGITVEWSPSAPQRGNTTYRLQRSTVDPSTTPTPNWATIADGLTGQSYSDNFFQTKTYWYQVIAVDYSGLESAPSAAVSATHTKAATTGTGTTGTNPN